MNNALHKLNRFGLPYGQPKNNTTKPGLKAPDEQRTYWRSFRVPVKFIARGFRVVHKFKGPTKKERNKTRKAAKNATAPIELCGL